MRRMAHDTPRRHGPSRLGPPLALIGGFGSIVSKRTDRSMVVWWANRLKFSPVGGVRLCNSRSALRTEPHVLHTRASRRAFWINVYREKWLVAGAGFEPATFGL